MDAEETTKMRTIRAEEQDLGLVVEIHEALLDPGALSGDQQVQDGLPHQQPREHCASHIDEVDSRDYGKGEERTSTYFSKQRRGLAPKLSSHDRQWM